MPRAAIQLVHLPEYSPGDLNGAGLNLIWFVGSAANVCDLTLVAQMTFERLLFKLCKMR